MALERGVSARGGRESKSVRGSFWVGVLLNS